MSESSIVLRILVASPGDVEPKRAVVPGVIDELNRDVGADRRLRLELVRWEIDDTIAASLHRISYPKRS
jgi:hypothetical protein